MGLIKQHFVHKVEREEKKDKNETLIRTEEELSALRHFVPTEKLWVKNGRRVQSITNGLF